MGLGKNPLPSGAGGQAWCVASKASRRKKDRKSSVLTQLYNVSIDFIQYKCIVLKIGAKGESNTQTSQCVIPVPAKTLVSRLGGTP